MRIRIFLYLILVLSLEASVKAQSDTVFNQTDANNQKQGYWKKNFPNGKPMYRGFFKDNKPVGEMRRYFESGALKAVMNYDSKGEYAHVRLLYEDGQLAAEGKYFNSLKDSTWVYFSYYDRSVTTRETYLKGVRQGMMINYYSNGDVSEKIEWNHDKKSGKWEQYFLGNTLKLKGSYVDNKLEGPFLVNYFNGKPNIKGTYLNNQRKGKWIFFKEDGTVETELEYVNGKATNEDKLDAAQQELFRTIDENQGKFEEPDESNFLIPQNR